MTWLKTDDKFPEHRKIRRLSDGAYRLHHTALCACAKDETDGAVTVADLADMEHGPRLRKYVDALVDAGLWHTRGNGCGACPDAPVGGWVIHDFLSFNPSHATQNAKRQRDRERQQQWRDRKTKDEPSQRDNGVTDVLSHDPVPTRPDPSRPGSWGTSVCG